MKIKTWIIAVMMIGLASVNAQTNVTNIDTNSVSENKGEPLSFELTIGGGGSTVKSESEGGLDISLSCNPLSSRREIWVGVGQSIYMSPKLSGSTDVFVDWSWHIAGKLYLNTGWNNGIVYDGSSYFRTGPELVAEYYVVDNAFIYSGINFDIVSKGDNGLRYSFGIGLNW